MILQTENTHDTMIKCLYLRNLFLYKSIDQMMIWPEIAIKHEMKHHSNQRYPKTLRGEWKAGVRTLFSKINSCIGLHSCSLIDDPYKAVRRFANYTRMSAPCIFLPINNKWETICSRSAVCSCQQ